MATVNLLVRGRADKPGLDVDSRFELAPDGTCVVVIGAAAHAGTHEFKGNKLEITTASAGATTIHVAESANELVDLPVGAAVSMRIRRGKHTMLGQVEVVN